MSTTGRGGRLAGPSAAPGCCWRRAQHGREAYVESSATLGGHRLSGYPTRPDAHPRARRETFDRGHQRRRRDPADARDPRRSPTGPAALGQVSRPALVIHGLADKMVHVSGGRATAAAIPGAELLLVPGMGHDLPVRVCATFRGGDRADGGPRRAAATPGSAAGP